jgi:hypothetical protein
MDISKRYDKSGHLTLDGMRAVLDEGGAVLYRGVTITDRAALPTKAQIAALSGKAEDKALAASEIQGQMAAMQAQLDALSASPGPQPDDAPSREGTTVPDDQKPAESVTGEPGVLPAGNGKTAPKTDTTDGPGEAPDAGAAPNAGGKRP